MTEEKAKSLIGRKVRGFKFDDENINYIKDMDDYIGRTGVIDNILSCGNYFLVDFTDVYFIYPASLIEAHLVEENESESSEIEQLKAENAELVDALKDFIHAIDSDKVILASEYEQAKQILEKYGK